MNCAFITIGVTRLRTDDYVHCLPRKLRSNIISYAPKNVTSQNQRSIYRATSSAPSYEPILCYDFFQLYIINSLFIIYIYWFYKKLLLP